MMADSILHSVVEPPKPLEANSMNKSIVEPPKSVEANGVSKSINPRVAELLQSIYSVSRTAATSIGLGKAIDSAKDLQSFVDPDEVLEFSLEAGYDAVNKVWSDAEELAKLLDIDLKRPISYKLKPVYAEK
ncbi:MAG: hypothetical protein ABFS24_00695 [Pseudomonadota bacterium]